jgi:fructokinase
MTGFVAVVGENVADAIVQPPDPHPGVMSLLVVPGGGPANAAVALGRLGTPTRFIGRMPRGVLGRLFAQRLTDADVDLSSSTWSDDPATLAIASLGDDLPHYDFYARDTADWRWQPAELDPERFAGAACVHTGSLALIMPPGAQVIEDLLDNVRDHTTISIDPNVRIGLVDAEDYRSRLKEWCRLADVHDLGVRLAIVTRGRGGAIASLGGHTIDVPAVPTRAVDTIGAGDAFSAGLLHWLHHNHHLDDQLDRLDGAGLRRALMFAAHVAGLTCAMPGADPPRRRDLPPVARQLLG